MIQASAFTDVFVPLADLTLAGATLALFAHGLGRAGLSPSARRNALMIAGLVYALWYGGLTLLARHDVFLATPRPGVPALPIAVFAPVVLFFTLAPRWRYARRAFAALPLDALIGVQVLRVMGFVFLVEWALGNLPAVFALPAALGDITVGLLALPVARLVARRSPLSGAAFFAWTALGLADFASALATGFLSSPGPFQRLALDHPNLIASAYPLAMIPVFGVPVFIALHGLALRKWFAERPAALPAPAAPAGA